MTKPPTFRSGKICYIEIPATDVARSAAFYERVFGWQVRRREDGSTAFDDTVNEVSGTWVMGRTPSSQPGLVVHIMVANAAAAVDAIVEAGGKVVQPIDPESHVVYALFSDPAGNVLGVYQQPGLAETEEAELPAGAQSRV